MTYYPGFFDESLIPKDETVEPHPTDTHEMVPRKNLEDTILKTSELRTVVIRPGFVYGAYFFLHFILFLFFCFLTL